jgi:SNF family Na+-dependent transporter
MQGFLSAYQGLTKNAFFQSLWPAYIFFCLTFLANFVIVYHGISRGIEKFCKIAMPVLLGFAFLMMLKVLSLACPDPLRPSWSVNNGLGFFWNPDFSTLKDAHAWLSAAGQIFFTLSVGIGVILTYASYLSKGDDVVLSGLTAVSINEFAEVILGGSIVIVAAFAFFGPTQIETIAKGGIFNLGFVTMPLIVNQWPLPEIFGFIWFFLLFLAAITSSISLAQPAIAFLEDEFNLSRKKAVIIFSSVAFLLCHIPIFFLSRGVVDELDFWGGTFFLVVFAAIEVILFAWVFGMDKAWEEIHYGADIKIPRIYKFIIKYITPLFLLLILGFWSYQDLPQVVSMQKVALADRPFVLAVRIILIALILVLAVLIKIAWRRRKLAKRL